nr:putative receptor-like protein kinase At3g47110 [Quercus suber]
MEGEIPSSLSNCSNLKFLNLYGNKLKGKVPTELGSLMKLKLLQLSTNNLVGGIPPSLGNLSSLTKFGVGDNNLVGNIPDAIGQLNGLVFFTIRLINCNQLNGTLPANIGLNLPNLQKFYVGGNEFSGSIPTSLCNATQLQRIDLVKNNLGLNENHFTGIIPTAFGKFEKMQALGLYGNRLSGEIPTSIGNLTQLFRIDLQDNIFEGTISPSLLNWQNLQHLDLSQNNLNGFIPLQLIGTSSLPLVNINLSHNSFMGKLPFEAGNLKNINEMDISNNNLSVEIPTSVGNCLILEYLYLQGNSFWGAIPSSMASLKGLRLLDVSQNNLSGPIPEGLEKLLFLEKLNLSFNNFEGEVPIKGVFKNISAISLIGHTKLCGGIQKLQLPKCPVNVMKPRKSIRFKHAIATNGFSPNNLIGSGNFGSIYKGFIHQEERSIAVKVVNLQQKGASKSFMVECNALRNIQHRNLVKILTCCSRMDYNGNQFKALVFELMTNGSLDFWLHQGLDNENQSRNLSLLQRLNVAIDVAFAIDYLHNHSVQPIIHCDLKPSNVLLDNDMVAHVSDFGLARLLPITNDSSEKQTSTIGIKGSIGYIAPGNFF